MDRSNFMSCKLSWLSYLLIPSLLACAGTKQTKPTTVSFHRFTVGDESYRIRSISSADKSEARNEVIGKHFVAVDFDKDRVIDRILLGEVDLSEAQRIYDFGLAVLTSENKLQQTPPTNHRYVIQSPDFYYEIRTFQPANAEPFNEFKLIDQRSILSQVTILIDHDADGTLEEILKGSVAMEEAQSRYAEMIQSGLRQGALVQVARTVLVAER